MLRKVVLVVGPCVVAVLIVCGVAFGFQWGRLSVVVALVWLKTLKGLADNA